MKNGRKARRLLNVLIVASALCFSAPPIRAGVPPTGFLRKIAERETANARARENYTFRQAVSVQEFNIQGAITGEYGETRDITFSPTIGRYEKVIVKGHSTLTRVRLTQEDFNDIRNIEPFLLTTENVSLYEGRYEGEETMDGVACFVEHVRPRQILAGQRFFEGILWVRQDDFAVIRAEGQAVPQIDNVKEQNLTPHFTTIRREIDGKWLFPVETYSDDTLFFRDFPQRLRTVVRYMNYKKFEAESTITFGEAEPNAPESKPTDSKPPAAKN
jgi:hypothetical protein